MDFIEIALIFAVIIFLGYFIKGLTGFAGALFSVPLLALFFDISFLVPVVSLTDMFSGLILFYSVKKHINKKELFFILCGALVGTIIGVVLLKYFTGYILKLILGVFIIIFSLKMVFGNSFYFHKLKSYFGTFFGLFGGIFGGMFSTSGPPITLYLGHRIREKQILRGTLIAFFLVDSIWRNSLYFVTGVFNNQVYKIALFMIPVLIIAIFCGSRIYLRLKEGVYRKIIGIILLISGIILILSNF